MIGSMFAGTDESPGQMMRVGDRRFKTYRGMGSMEAMEAGSSDRYFQDRSGDPEAEMRKLVPEGVVARVPARGPVGESIYMLIGGLRACGARPRHPVLRRARPLTQSCPLWPVGIR